MSDWLYLVGVDTQAADKDIAAFVRRTTDALNSIGKTQLDLDTRGASTKLTNITNRANEAEGALKRLTTTSGAAFSNLASSIDRSSSSISRHSQALGQNKDAWDLLGRIAGNTVFKFIEYEVIMKAFNGTVQEFARSIHQAAEVQMEQSLQRLYNGTLDVNAALRDAIVIAKQWGADITDVQQVIGLWSKNTHDLAGAVYLANEAEKMHRASGIETQEVYRMSIAMAQQLGLKLKDLPAVYDQVANAALKIAVPMKALGKGGQMEAMKELFEGLAESSATLKAMGFDTAGIIAVVGNQIQAMGESGKSAAKNLTSMFAALEGKGTYRKNFEEITGHFKDTDDLIDKMITKAPQLYQAYANGDLGVRPQQFETLQTFEASLKRIKQLRDEIGGGNSKGALNLIAENQMSQFLGQMDRLKASFQELNLEIGNKLLPTATAFVHFLNGGLFPALAAHAGQLVTTAALAGKLGVAWLLLTAESRIGKWFTDTTAEMVRLEQQTNANIIISNRFKDQELATAEGMQQAIVQMNREKAALEELQKAEEVATWRATGLRTECSKLEVSMSQVATMAETRVPGAFAAMATGIKTAMSGILASVGPLLRMFAIMQAITSLGENMDKSMRVAQAADLDSTYNYHTGAGGAAQHGLNAIGMAVNKPFLISDPKTYGALVHQLDHEKGGPGTPGFMMRAALYQREQGMKHGNQGAVDQASEVIKQLVLDKLNQNIPDYLKKIPQTPPASLDTTIPGTGALQEPFYNKAAKAKADHSIASEQQQFAESVNSEKRDASAEMTKWADKAKALKTYISTQELLATTLGTTQARINNVETAYKQEGVALANEQGAAEKEIKNLQQRIDHGKQLLSHHASNTKAYEAEKKAIDMAEAAMQKAQGRISLLARERELLNVKMQQTLTLMQSHKALSEIGGSGVQTTPFGNIPEAAQGTTGTVKDLHNQLTMLLATFANARGPLNQYNVAQIAQNQIFTIGKGLVQYYNQLLTEQRNGHVVDKTLLQELNGLISAYSAGWKKAGDVMVTGTTQNEALQKSLRDLMETVSGKNLATLEDILHIDKGQSDAVKLLASGYKEIADEIDKLNTIESSYYGNIDADVQNTINLTKQQIELQQQLLPLIAEEKRIRESVTFKATQDVLTAHGTKALDTVIDNMLGKAKSGLASLVGDWLKEVVNSWWKATAERLTEAIFKTPAQQQEARLRELYANNIKAQQLIAKQLEDKVQVMMGKHVDRFVGGVSDFGKNVDKFVKGAHGLGSGKGSGIDPVLAKQNADNHQATADNTAATADSLAAILAAIQNPDMSNGGGIQSLLGTLAENIPALKKFMGTPTGVRIGNALDGIAQGQMFGQMQGGGSHSVWGSVGGAIGGYFGGPLGATAGSFIGSLFGHADDPAKMPDKFDTQNYGSFVSNMNGVSGTFNGQTISPGAQYDAAHGGIPEQKRIWTWINDANNTKGLNDADKLVVDRLKQLGGSNGDLGIAKEHDGQFTLASGATIGVTEYENLIASFDKLSNNMSSLNKTLAPLISISVFGASANYQMNPYNIPGMSAAEQKALVDNQFKTLPGYDYYQTPGMPGTGVMHPLSRSSANIVPASVVKITTHVVLDGTVVAKSVNAINTQEASRYGDIAA